MAHRKQGYKFENDWSREELREREIKIKSRLVVPINVEIKADHVVLNFDKVKDFLNDATKISLMECSCRKKLKHCDNPLETCIGLDEKAEQFLTSEKNKDLHPREVAKDEALTVLKKSHDAGLVHMAYIYNDSQNAGRPDIICSCCSCCCHVLGGITRYGIAPQALKSEMTSVTDDSICTGCGLCVDRCQFGARKLVAGSISLSSDYCFGCGLCASTCPTNAIKIVRKKD